MSRGVVLVALSLVVLLACSDDKAPSARGAVSSSDAASVAPAASVSPQERSAAETLARGFVTGLQQGAPGTISNDQADCVVGDVVAGLNAGVLAGLAASEPDPSGVPPAIRAILLEAFDHCLSPAVASDLRQRFG
jgi:hypothetical protein